MVPSDDEWLTADEAAQYLKVSRSTVYRWVREQRLNLYHPGPATSRFRRDELDRLAHAQPHESVEPPKKSAPEGGWEPTPLSATEFLEACRLTAEGIGRELQRPLPDSTALLRSLRSERHELP